MKAIILAAGKGTRLGDLTKEIPKPMLPINGKPLLEYIIRYLKENGINDIGVNLYTKSNQITDYFKNGSKLNVNIYYSFEENLLGTAGSLLKFKDWLKGEDDFVVIYGDILTNQQLAPLIKLHKKNNAFATLFLHKRKESNSFTKLNKSSKIIEFKERPNKDELKLLIKDNPNGFFVNSAIQMLNIKALNYIETHSCFDLPKDVYSKVLFNENIFGLKLTGNRIAIDSPERYNEAIITVGQHIL